jgi:hypothetical protein
MKRLLAIFGVLLSSVLTHAQGQVLFANRAEAVGLDVPVFILGTLSGPGAGWATQLLLVGSNGSLTPLLPMSAFQTPLRTDPTRDRYWSPQTVEVPGVLPGNPATFIVRAWEPALGTFEQVIHSRIGMWAESTPFTVTLGGTLDPAPLVTLQSFTIGWPEPSTYILGIVGGTILFLCRRK